VAISDTDVSFFDVVNRDAQAGIHVPDSAPTHYDNKKRCSITVPRRYILLALHVVLPIFCVTGLILPRRIMLMRTMIPISSTVYSAPAFEDGSQAFGSVR
jgi:hypothetical protein